MGAFNSVMAELTCPSCGSRAARTVQFKYGSTWQLAYVVGDTLAWGGNDRGRPGTTRVVLDGAVEPPCPNCGYSEEVDAYIFVVRDEIEGVLASDGTYDFAAAGDTFIVIQE